MDYPEITVCGDAGMVDDADRVFLGYAESAGSPGAKVGTSHDLLLYTKYNGMSNLRQP
jgi:hypothetical protein